MTFLHVLLLILKIIGIVLLSVLGLVVLTVLVVLFVPVRYRASGGYSDGEGGGISLKASVTWLLHIIRFKYEYGAEPPLSFKVLWIDLMKDRDKDKEPDWDSEPDEEPAIEHGKEPFNESVEDPGPEIIEIEDEPKFGSLKPKDDEPEQGSEVDPLPEDHQKTDPEPEPEKEQEPKEQKGDQASEPDESVDPGKHRKEKKTTHNETGYGKIKKYVELIKSDRFKRAFRLAKDSLIKILKHILPRKWRIDATLGFDDPSTLGTILGINGMFYPILHKHLFITDVWDREIIDVKGQLKGRITLGKLAFIALKAYFNKDVRRIIKMFKEA